MPKNPNNNSSTSTFEKRGGVGTNKPATSPRPGYKPNTSRGGGE